MTDAGRASRSTVTIAASSWAKGDSEGTLDTSSYTDVDFAIVFSNATATAAPKVKFYNNFENCCKILNTELL